MSVFVTAPIRRTRDMSRATGVCVDGTRAGAGEPRSWVLRGRLLECPLFQRAIGNGAGFKPIITRRSTIHRVLSIGTTWIFTLRGPWSKTWPEYSPTRGRLCTVIDFRHSTFDEFSCSRDRSRS
jgi:hypothetical protein